MLKTFVIYHKNSNYINENHFIPIRVGNKKDFKNDILSDDTGDNIAEKNTTYNELTAIYWLWKNYDKIGNPDFIGIQHYRRFFYTKDKNFNYYEAETLSDDTKELINLDNAEQILKDYDFIVPCPMIVERVDKDFLINHNKEDIISILDILKEHYTKYFDCAVNYLNGKRSYLFNMFIFPKEIFFNYCEWLFSILDIFYKNNVGTKRCFISERLTGIYITWLLKNGKTCYHMPIIYITGKKSFKQAVTQANINRKNKLTFKKIIKPIVNYFMPQSLWLKWKRKNFESL